MNEAELRKHAQCSLCERPIGHTGLPLFWRVKVERFGVDMHAVRRQTGLAMLIGNSSLASVMGPDEQMAQQLLQVDLTVCETCACERHLPVAAMGLEIKA